MEFSVPCRSIISLFIRDRDQLSVDNFKAIELTFYNFYYWPEPREQHLVDQYPLQDQDFPPALTTELQNEVSS